MDKIIVIVGALVVLVNIITEVVKNLSDRLKTSKIINTFVLVLSVVLSVVAYIFYAHFQSLSIDAYGIVASIVVGFLVAFGAMFGFDKLLKYIEPYLKRDGK